MFSFHHSKRGMARSTFISNVFILPMISVTNCTGTGKRAGWSKGIGEREGWGKREEGRKENWEWEGRGKRKREKESREMEQEGETEVEMTNALCIAQYNINFTPGQSGPSWGSTYCAVHNHESPGRHGLDQLYYVLVLVTLLFHTFMLFLLLVTPEETFGSTKSP